MKRIPRPRAFRSPSRLRTSIRVEASSMLMISSATSRRMSSSSARAISMRWSWPPLSWCGYLPSTSAGLRFTASSDALELRAATPRSSSRRSTALRTIAKTRSALKIGLYELNGSWKTPCTSRVVGLQRAALERRDVDAVERDRAARRAARGGGSSSRSSTCRSRSRRSATTTSPGRTRNETSWTASISPRPNAPVR